MQRVNSPGEARILEALTSGGTVAFAMASQTVSTAVLTLADDFGFTEAQLARAKRAFITSTKAAVRYTYDGTAPTDELGHLLPQDATPPLDVLGVANIANLQFILDSGAATDAIVLVTLEE
ncbi:MAG: hypothetical protein M0R37_10585 [Bacteroidales bacterium]|jgi:hypothetical protein|nr:hypothetical protein [Bacteroidales bacterium]